MYESNVNDDVAADDCGDVHNISPISAHRCEIESDDNSIYLYYSVPRAPK